MKSYHNKQKKQTLQVCDLKHALSVDADIHLDCTGRLEGNKSQHIVFELDVNAKDITGDDIIDLAKQLCHKKYRVLISVKNFDDSQERASEKCNKIVGLLIKMVKILEEKKNLVIRINCLRGQNRSAVVACRYAASSWLGAPNMPCPAAYQMFKLLCKNYRNSETEINDSNPRDSYPMYGYHISGWPHSEICKLNNRHENKYPGGGSGCARINYDTEYTHTQLIYDEIKM